MIIAARNGHEEVINVLLIFGVDIDQTGTVIAALWCAAAWGRIDITMLRRLYKMARVKLGAEVNCVNISKTTCLMDASERRYFDIVQSLLEKGEMPMAIELYLYAAERGHLSITKLLVENGTDTAFTDRKGQTALHKAAENGHLSITKLLVKKGADTAIADCTGQTALHKATERGHLSISKLLVENGADTAITDSKGQTALHKAAESGHLSISKLLVENGADTAITDSKGQTALHKAAESGHLSLSKLLVENGADTAITDCTGQTALHKATERGHFSISILLVENGAAIAIADCTGQTALHKAAERGHLSISKLLVDSGVTMTKDNDGLTPLMLAANNCKTVIVEYLSLFPECSRKDSIDTTELIGSAQMFQEEEIYDDELPVAYHYFQKAMQDRIDGHEDKRIVQTDLSKILDKKECTSMS